MTLVDTTNLGAYLYLFSALRTTIADEAHGSLALSIIVIVLHTSDNLLLITSLGSKLCTDCL